MDLNNVCLSGRLGSDIELRKTKSDHSVCEVNLAVVSGYGEKKETYWIGLTMWGARAEAANQHLKKGSKIMVIGELEQSSYEKDGSKITKTRVKVVNWFFNDAPIKNGESSQSHHSEPSSAHTGPSTPSPAPSVAGSEDDIPF